MKNIKKAIRITKDIPFKDSPECFVYKGDILLYYTHNGSGLVYTRLSDNKTIYLVDIWLNYPSSSSYLPHEDISDRFDGLCAFL